MFTHCVDMFTHWALYLFGYCRQAINHLNYIDRSLQSLQSHLHPPTHLFNKYELNEANYYFHFYYLIILYWFVIHYMLGCTGITKGWLIVHEL